MTRFAAILTVLLLALAAPVAAKDRPVLIELFTSQGCSSCPPADALLKELAAREDVIALALHVDYWDYIGWADTFASPAHSARQRGYARAGGRKMVYTPQMIIGGVDHVVGNRPKDVARLIEAHKARAGEVDLSVSRADGRLQIDAPAAPGASGPAVVQVARFRPEATVEVRRGENAGRTLDYTNVVTQMEPVADWDMAAPLALNLPLEGDLPAAVLIQRGRHGPVMAVAVAP